MPDSIEEIEPANLFRFVFEASPVGIGLSDDSNVFLAVNAALCALFDLTEDELVGRSVPSLLHPDDVDVEASAESLAVADDGIVRSERRYLRPDGEVRWASFTETLIDSPTGRPWTLAHLEDITERKRSEHALAVSRSNLAAVAAVMERLQSGEDIRSTIVDSARGMASAQFASMIEPGQDDLLVVTASTEPTFVGLAVEADSTSAAAEAFATGRTVVVHDPASSSRLMVNDAELSLSRLMWWVPLSARGTVSGVLVVSWTDEVDEFDQRAGAALSLLAGEAALALYHDQLVSELELASTTDALTGLLNRRGCQARLQNLIKNARRTESPLTVAMLDLDHFKAYNDRLGHAAGDDLLAGFGTSSARVLRDIDVIARWGGEEFVIAFPYCPASEAEAVLERVRLSVPDGQTCSIGHATWDGTEDLDQLLERADIALYEAKATGRNRIVSG